MKETPHGTGLRMRGEALRVIPRGKHRLAVYRALQVHFTSKNVDPATKTRRRATLAPTWNQLVLSARCNHRPVLLRVASYRPYLHLLRRSLNSIGWSLRYPQLSGNIFRICQPLFAAIFPGLVFLRSVALFRKHSPSLRAICFALI